MSSAFDSELAVITHGGKMIIFVDNQRIVLTEQQAARLAVEAPKVYKIMVDTK